MLFDEPMPLGESRKKDNYWTCDEMIELLVIRHRRLLFGHITCCSVFVCKLFDRVVGMDIFDIELEEMHGLQDSDAIRPAVVNRNPAPEIIRIERL